MCMKNVNATMFMCSGININDGVVDSFNGIFDSIIPVKEEDGYYIENVNIVLNSTILFDSRFNELENCFEIGKKYEFMIRLTHVESGLGISLLNFDLCLEKEQLKTWCKDFYELKRVLRTSRIYIPKGLGNYALKLLIRAKTEDDSAGWNTQTIHSLTVGEAR